ncbi:S9 family peptidase [Flindersiella endophytica]
MTTKEPADSVSYPRLSARTLRFSLGAPRNFTVSPDGERVVFLRAPSGTDRGTMLWTYDVASGAERVIVEPAALLSAADEELSPEERARRERLREGAGGVVGYATDTAVKVAAFALSSRLWVADLDTGEVRELPAQSPVVDPRPDPTGTYVAYASNGQLRVSRVDGTLDRALAEPGSGPGSDTIAWGTAEFIASEELDRFRGFWWSPDGTSLLTERYDEAPVHQWSIADPANPDREPAKVRYPAAGTPNADVSLWFVDVGGHSRLEVEWDRERFPYVADVSWPADAAGPLLWVLSRDQRTAQLLAVDTESRTTKLLHEATDDAWIDVVPGAPALLPDGRLLTIADEPGTRRLAVDGKPVTPEGLQVAAVLHTGEHGVLMAATTEPTEQHVYRVAPDGTLTALTRAQGVHTARAGGSVVVLTSTSLDYFGVQVRVLKDDAEVGQIASLQAKPPLEPNVTLVKLGERELRAAVLFPRDHTPGSRKLPMLLAPYGGPHGAMARAALSFFLTPQWLADQGFCVIVADGRGTPNRGPAWERLVLNDFASTLDDQVEAVQRVAELYPADVDADRVAIRGWSYGGYLSALAVIERGDVFHAAVAGAPVTDWRLYDTAYTERYLGDPNEQPEVYDRNGLIDTAGKLERPLLLIHGLADDNVVVANTLRLSGALLAAGRPHTVIPLSGVTHMTPQEVVAENLLLLEVEFFHRVLPAVD